MEITLIIVCVVLLFLVLILIRNELVYKYRIKALNIVSKKADKWINSIARKPKEEDYRNHLAIMDRWIEYYDKKDSYGDYNQMVFDFRKWTFDQFYSGIEDFEIEN